MPPVKKSRGMGAAFSANSMPPFTAKALEPYPAANGESPLRKAVDNARKVLHDVAGSKDNLPDEFLASANEKQFKDNIEQVQRKVAGIASQLQEALEEIMEGLR